MVDFKKQAEDWAEKETKNRILEQTKEDFLDLIMGLPVAYHIDKEGNKRKLSRQELFDLRTDELMEEYKAKRDEK